MQIRPSVPKDSKHPEKVEEQEGLPERVLVAGRKETAPEVKKKLRNSPLPARTGAAADVASPEVEGQKRSPEGGWTTSEGRNEGWRR